MRCVKCQWNRLPTCLHKLGSTSCSRRVPLRSRCPRHMQCSWDLNQNEHCSCVDLRQKSEDRSSTYVVVHMWSWKRSRWDETETENQSVRVHLYDWWKVMLKCRRGEQQQQQQHLAILRLFSNDNIGQVDSSDPDQASICRSLATRLRAFYYSYCSRAHQSLFLTREDIIIILHIHTRTHIHTCLFIQNDDYD